MARSIWKGPYVDPYVIKKSRSEKEHKIKIWSRKSIILPQFVGKTFDIHNGKRFIPVYINPDMVGHKFGEFALTRKICNHKKKIKR